METLVDMVGVHSTQVLMTPLEFMKVVPEKTMTEEHCVMMTYFCIQCGEMIRCHSEKFDGKHGRDV